MGNLASSPDTVASAGTPAVAAAVGGAGILPPPASPVPAGLSPTPVSAHAGRISVYLASKESVRHKLPLLQSWRELLGAVRSKWELPDTVPLTITRNGAPLQSIADLVDGDTLCVATGVPSILARSVPFATGVAVVGGGGTAAAAESSVSFNVYTAVSAASMADFEFLGLVAVTTNELVFKVRCKARDMPDASKLFTLKMCFRLGSPAEVEEAKLAFRNEAQVLSSLPPHAGVARFWRQFTDKLPDAALNLLPGPIRTALDNGDSASSKRVSQFMLLDHHPHALVHSSFVKSYPMPVRMYLTLAHQLLDVACHLASTNTVHLFLKPEHVLVADGGRLCVCEFAHAIRFNDSKFRLACSKGMNLKVPPEYLAPEVLNALHGARSTASGAGDIDFHGQLAWEVGHLLWQLATGKPPYPGYPARYRSLGTMQVKVDPSLLPELDSKYPAEIRQVLASMLATDAASRPAVADVLTVLNATWDYLLDGASACDFPALLSPSIRGARRRDEEEKGLDLTGRHGEDSGVVHHGRRAITPRSTSPEPRSPTSDDSDPDAWDNLDNSDEPLGDGLDADGASSGSFQLDDHSGPVSRRSSDQHSIPSVNLSPSSVGASSRRRGDSDAASWGNSSHGTAEQPAVRVPAAGRRRGQPQVSGASAASATSARSMPPLSPPLAAISGPPTPSSAVVGGAGGAAGVAVPRLIRPPSAFSQHQPTSGNSNLDSLDSLLTHDVPAPIDTTSRPTHRGGHTSRDPSPQSVTSRRERDDETRAVTARAAERMFQ